MPQLVTQLLDALARHVPDIHHIDYKTEQAFYPKKAAEDKVVVSLCTTLFIPVLTASVPTYIFITCASLALRCSTKSEGCGGYLCSRVVGMAAELSFYMILGPTVFVIFQTFMFKVDLGWVPSALISSLWLIAEALCWLTSSCKCCCVEFCGAFARGVVRLLRTMSILIAVMIVVAGFERCQWYKKDTMDWKTTIDECVTSSEPSMCTKLTPSLQQADFEAIRNGGWCVLSSSERLLLAGMVGGWGAMVALRYVFWGAHNNKISPGGDKCGKDD